MKILVATDGSPGGREAVKFAARLLRGLLLGSMALKLLHGCPCPVAVVQPRKR